jgi:TonB family protein
VLADGSVSDVQVEHTAGEEFDQAAVAAVEHWTFEPARRAGQPIASRVGVAVHFELPELAVVDVAAVTEAADMVPHEHEPAPQHSKEGEPLEFAAKAQVRARLRHEERSASDFRLDRAALAGTPHRDAAELLNRAPGMVVTRIEGDAVGHRLMLRGFDADHGQDVELSVDSVPVNQPSHVHGQGYADLGFLIPETVKGLRVIEGVYDPAQGDFAVAGSAEFELGVEQRGVQLSSSYGSFHTFRELALWAPEGASDDTFGAVTFRKTRGFGQNRAATSGAAIAQGTLGVGKLKLTLHGSLYASRADTANVLRRDDIASGKVDFYDVYPLATTEAQSGWATRGQLSARLRHVGEAGANSELTLFYVRNDFRLAANYTGFTQISELNPEWTGRGDLIEQLNTTRTIGVRARHRTRSFEPKPGYKGSLEVGLSARADDISQAQNLLQAPANTTWDKRIDADIFALDLGGFLDLDLTLSRYVGLRGGVRFDYLDYRVDDRLSKAAAAERPAGHIPGDRRTAAGVVAGPRVVLDVKPMERLVLSVAYGEGYRSPQALLLHEGESAPFTKVRSGDLGVRYRVFAGDELSLRATGYLTHVAQDILFDAVEGAAEPYGPTTRLGTVLSAESRLFSWLLLSLSATYVHATLDEPPRESPEDPRPPFEKGQLLPYVPPWVLRGDLSGRRSLYEVRGAPLEGHAGVGYTFWSRRPLPFSQFSPAVSLLDASVGVSYRVLDLEASVTNLLDARFAALELSYASNFDPDAVPSRLPARHIMAGAPRTWLVTLGVRL